MAFLGVHRKVLYGCLDARTSPLLSACARPLQLYDHTVQVSDKKKSCASFLFSPRFFLSNACRKMAELEDEHMYGLAVGLGSAGAFIVLMVINIMFCKFGDEIPTLSCIFFSFRFFFHSLGEAFQSTLAHPYTRG